MMEQLLSSIQEVKPIKVWGKVTNIVGLIVEGYCPQVTIGSLCEILPSNGEDVVQAEVVGFRDSLTLLMPLGELHGLGPGDLIRVSDTSATTYVGTSMLGRVIDALGNPLDNKRSMNLYEKKPIYSLPPGPMERERIKDPLDLGVKSINGLITCGIGQRMAIMAGSGVGKSSLLGMMGRDTKADVNVIALIGERGREVREFIEQDLGEEGLARSVVVVATSDQSPILRMRGAFVATTIAEYFSSQNYNVLLMMDSVTRYAMAMREIGLAVGEPPTTKGYPPSVFAKMPKFLERAGNFKNSGSITGLYTVLVEGDDMNEPVADTVRSILDGHIVLSRKLAAKNHYPPVDILQSTSRLMREIIGPEHMELSSKLQEILATYQESEDLINIGAYTQGTNSKIDYALKYIEAVNNFLRQDRNEKITMQETISYMKSIFT